MKIPYLGANRKANKNIKVCAKTIDPPGTKSNQKLTNIPIMLEIIALQTEIKIILSNLSVSKYAVAPGVINIATTNIIPTDCKPTTAAKDVHVSNK